MNPRAKLIAAGLVKPYTGPKMKLTASQEALMARRMDNRGLRRKTETALSILGSTNHAAVR